MKRFNICCNSDVTVAEKLNICLMVGILLKIYSISSLNHISNIRSASSSTTYSTFFISMIRLSMRSINLPGVAMTICAHCWSFSCCLRDDIPPVTIQVLIPISPRERLKNSSSVCVASSLVGHITTTCTHLLLGSIALIKGMTKAAVLPVPVCD